MKSWAKAMIMEKPDARERALKLLNITPEQQHIIDIWIREKNEKLRHWERRSGDSNIYIEYLNGVAFLDNLITEEINIIKAREQKKNNNRRK